MLLWSGLLSPFSLKIRLYMQERGIEYETHDIPWSRKNLWGPKPEAFLTANPRGEVPTLFHNDVAIADSTLIWQHLEDLDLPNPLFSSARGSRTQQRIWENKADNAMSQELVTLISEGFMQPDGGGDQTALEQARNSLMSYFAELDETLAGSDYLVDDYSIADIATLSCIVFAQQLGAEIPKNCQHLQGWFTRVTARPVCQAELGKLIVAAAAA